MLVEYDVDGHQPSTLIWNASAYDGSEGIIVVGSDIYTSGYLGPAVSPRNATLVRYRYGTISTNGETPQDPSDNPTVNPDLTMFLVSSLVINGVLVIGIVYIVRKGRK